MSDLDRLAQRVKEEPRSIAFVAYADGLRKAGRFKEAWDALFEGGRQHPDMPSARLVAARLHLAEGRNGLALLVAGEVVAADPANDAARLVYTKLLIEFGRFREARHELTRLAMSGVGEAAALSSVFPPLGEPRPGDSPFVSWPALQIHLARLDFRAALDLVKLWRRDLSDDPVVAELHSDVVRASRGHHVPGFERLPLRSAGALPGARELREVLWAEAAEQAIVHPWVSP